MDILFENYFKTMNAKVATIENRREAVEVSRKAKRDTTNFARRNINSNLSPFVTPTPKKPLRSIKKAEKKDDEKKDAGAVQKSNPSADVIPARLARLAKWKAEKVKQKELQKANSKPLFKVCHVPSGPIVNLENANKTIKGRPIKSATPKVSKFAPVNHTFRPPKGVQPLQFGLPAAQQDASTKPNQKQKSPAKMKKVTRSKVNDGATKLSAQTNNLPKRPLRAVRRIQKNDLPGSSSKPEPLLAAKEKSPVKSKTKKKAVGFDKNKSFETKLALRKTPKRVERLVEEESKNKGNSSENSPPKSKTKNKSVGFDKNNSLESQSETKLAFRKTPKRVERLVEEESKNKGSSPDYPINYSHIKNEVTPTQNKTTPVYISPFVTMSRGKSSARKEYAARQSLLSTEENEKYQNPYTTPQAGADYFSTKLDNEIARITTMCDTWKDYLQSTELPEEAQSSIDVCLGQSNLLISKKFEQFRSLIIECQTENYSEKPITCADLHGFWDMVYMQVEDLDRRFANLEKLRANNWEEILPEKAKPEKRAKGRAKKAQASSKLKEMIQQARQKKIRNVATSGNTSQCGLSPGLTMMKISQSIKNGDGLTPAKSILKTDASKSTGKKSVVFMEDVPTHPKGFTKINLFNDSDKENQSTNANLISFSPIKLTPRRSARISKKLY